MFGAFAETYLVQNRGAGVGPHVEVGYGDAGAGYGGGADDVDGGAGDAVGCCAGPVAEGDVAVFDSVTGYYGLRCVSCVS